MPVLSLKQFAERLRNMIVASRTARQWSDGSSLEAMLKMAAVADNWGKVIRRCAWCKRMFDESGTHHTVVAFNEATVTTDGMCPECGERALAQIAARRGRIAA
jgi:hypothetical protein